MLKSIFKLGRAYAGNPKVTLASISVIVQCISVIIYFMKIQRSVPSFAGALIYLVRKSNGNPEKSGRPVDH